LGGLKVAVELVFRTIGERTRELAFELAIEHIRPDRVHVIENAEPFSEAVRQMLSLQHDCAYVVYVDADCLILEDLRAAIDRETAPYIDCFVSDRFRGRIHCGVHITRIDVVRKMAEIVPPEEDKAYVLRPESRLRNLAMRELGFKKKLRNFDILHDYFQDYRDVFAKYALRELRSRNDRQRARLAFAMARWKRRDHPDFRIASQAVEYARELVPPRASVEQIAVFVESLRERSAAEIARLGLAGKGEFSRQELTEHRRREAHQVQYARSWNKPKVFGIGLSRTGTRSLTFALQILGFDVCHYPTDAETYYELAHGQYDFAVLDEHDGITDITVSPYYAQLDKIYPGSKFILTVREKDSWLRSCRNHWWDRPAFAEGATPERERYMKIRRLLRAAVFGCYEFDVERFSWVYDVHLRNVKEHFAGRPESLLILDVCDGEHWGPLCRFLERESPTEPFPHKGNKLSEKMKDLELFV
jgi:hypothetical protein